jgi:Ca2+-binding RTX toxin-like protein
VARLNKLDFSIAGGFMPTFTFSGGNATSGFNMQMWTSGFLLALLGDDNTVATGNGTQASFVNSMTFGGPDSILAVGSFGNYNADGPQSGTVNGFTYSTNYFSAGSPSTMLVTGLSIAVPTLNQWVFTDDAQALENVLFGGADTMTGGVNPEALIGFGGNDTIDGGGGNDNLIGGLGNDTLIGGAGDDQLDYFGQHEGNDTISGGDGNDVIGSAGVDTIDGGAGVDTVDLNIGGSTPITLSLADASTGTGVTLPNGTVIRNVEVVRLGASSGNDTLIVSAPGSGAFYAGDGFDTFVADLSAYSDGYNLAGTPPLQFFAGYMLDNVDRYVITTGGGADLLAAAGGDDVLSGGGGNDELHGGHGNDVLNGGAGNDILDGDNFMNGNGSGEDTASYAGAAAAVTVSLAIDGQQNTMGAGTDNLVSIERLTGSGFNDTLTGSSGANILSGGDGDDVLIGGAGADALSGGNGVDTARYTGASAGVIVNLANVAANTGDAAGDTFTSIENVVGTSFADTLTGDEQANSLAGAAGADTLNGGGGVDTADYSADTSAVTVNIAANVAIDGGGSTDTLSSVENAAGSAFDDQITGSAIANGLSGGDGNDTLNGAEGADTLNGGAGADTLDGGAGVDALAGGIGDDVYLVEGGDVVTELTGEGTDSVYTSTHYTLSANIEALVAQGAAAINLFGNTLNNIIVGNSAQNTMDGGVGADTLIGGVGDDLYVIDDQLDVIIESAGEGTLDTIYTSFTYYQMGANVENTQITGGPGSYVVGNDVSNLLVGNTGADTLVGGIGADTLVGAAGDDFYIIADQDDVIIEIGSGGNDTILTSISYYQMGADVENLEMTGAGGTYAIGNALDNLIVGNLGADTLDGGLGGDFMVGHEGDDLYFVGDLGDRTVESANEGIDAIYASITWTTGANVENLVLLGNGNINGGGNELNNFIFGNSGSNLIIGDVGQDVLSGGGGADTFVYTNPTEGSDSISDFASGVDHISISAAGFGGGLVSGGATPFASGSTPSSVGASFLYDTDDGRLFWDSDGAGGAAAILIATLSGAPMLTASDIVIGP